MCENFQHSPLTQTKTPDYLGVKVLLGETSSKVLRYKAETLD